MVKNCTLVINPGSSSVRFRMYDGNNVAIDGIIDAIGGNSVVKTRKNVYDTFVEKKQRIKSFSEAGHIIYSLISKSKRDLQKVAYRVVSGGNLHCEITKKVLETLKATEKYDPQHMPKTVMLVEYFMKKLNAKHIACFDSAFHRTLPEKAKIYAIPLALSKKHSIYRKGFHGLSVEWMIRKTNEHKKFSKMIVAHLGNGVSMTAVRDGKSVDTSMGFTPLEGLVMGSRSGSIDPAIIVYLAEKEEISAKNVLNILETKSGLRGLCGDSDIRPVVARAQKGDKYAKLALSVFAYSFKKQLGAYVASLNGVDCIALGGGMVNSVPLRAMLLSDLDSLGIKLDKRQINKQIPVCISRGRVKVLLLNTDEQEIMKDIATRFG